MAGTGKAHLREDQEILLRVEDLVVEFPAGRNRKVHAVSGISFDVKPGETLGLVGESGCGKSTTGRAIMQLPHPTSGSVKFDGVEMTRLSSEDLRRTRTRLQMIFQDPISSLNPRRKVKDIVAEGLSIWGSTIGTFSKTRVNEVLDAVGLDPDIVADRRPHQFSGGQCQRICIARALVLDPKVIICDEPVSALDVSIQAQVINLLMDLQRDMQLSYLFISHNLAVVEHISHRIAVMYLGRIVEYTDKTTLFTKPLHPYTEALLAAVPVPDPAIKRVKRVVQGDVPSPLKPPSGCHFHTRCPYVEARCKVESPVLREVEPGHQVACHLR